PLRPTGRGRRPTGRHHPKGSDASRLLAGLSAVKLRDAARGGPDSTREQYYRPKTVLIWASSAAESMPPPAESSLVTSKPCGPPEGITPLSAYHLSFRSQLAR